MLKLTYSFRSDEFRYVTVIGEARGIKDLYFQLTNYGRNPEGATGDIGKIVISDFNGNKIDLEAFRKNPHPEGFATLLTNTPF